MEPEGRAAAHAALGDVKRLAIIDELAAGDHTVSELADLVGIRGNLLAHHLDVLETAGLIDRRVSEGDHRRRYVSLRWECLPGTPVRHPVPTTGVVFVCTANSARSPFAAGLWEQRTGHRAASAGSHPAAAVHPKAVEVAAEFGVDLSAAKPAGYDHLAETPALVISVCDRARESGSPPGRLSLHWSIPDPVLAGNLRSFRSAFGDISDRIDRLVQLSTEPTVP
jgi:ArsR family transcriptional regulator, arsenate/arsenite/antimonite-responsive transcriptional repressor / arsenate reductase (thioredoxin)